MLNSFINLFILCQDNAEVAQGSPWSSLIMIVLIIAIFYFMMIRPQQKKQKEIKKFRDGIFDITTIVSNFVQILNNL